MGKRKKIVKKGGGLFTIGLAFLINLAIIAIRASRVATTAARVLRTAKAVNRVAKIAKVTKNVMKAGTKAAKSGTVKSVTNALRETLRDMAIGEIADVVAKRTWECIENAKKAKSDKELLEVVKKETANLPPTSPIKQGVMNNTKEKALKTFLSPHQAKLIVSNKFTTPRKITLRNNAQIRNQMHGARNIKTGVAKRNIVISNKALNM